MNFNITLAECGPSTSGQQLPTPRKIGPCSTKCGAMPSEVGPKLSASAWVLPALAQIGLDIPARQDPTGRAVSRRSLVPELNMMSNIPRPCTTSFRTSPEPTEHLEHRQQ